jgi:hypothetical protein
MIVVVLLLLFIACFARVTCPSGEIWDNVLDQCKFEIGLNSIPLLPQSTELNEVVQVSLGGEPISLENTMGPLVGSL